MLPKKTTSDVLVWDYSLKKTFKECEEWLQTTIGRIRLPKILAEIQTCLSRDGKLDLAMSTDLGIVGHAYGIHTSSLTGKNDLANVAQPLHWAVDYSALRFRIQAFNSLPKASQLILPFMTSMKVAGVVMLSRWDEAETCARLLIDVAHKDQTLNPSAWRKDGWGKGTNDAFLIALFAQVFDIPTHYQSAQPLIPEYQALLEVWRTSDQAAFCAAMRASAQFHISRSKNATGRNNYEFDDYFHRVYPTELLAVQALRRREGLPEFKVQHLLIDTPWSIVRDLPPVDRHPLVLAIEARMLQDYPGFK